ncbi:MAG: hypothetical protein QOG50_3157 [Actinomycetota bacterium]|nr:hypothetical protein [Actinomycetota bacterium]
MAEIIVHAGMPKTGSSSIQSWLMQNHDRLTDGEIQLVVATNRTRRNPGPEVHLEPLESGEVNSGQLILAWAGDGYAPRIPERFVSELNLFAERYQKMIVTGEALSAFFYRLDAPFLTALDELARAHTVRVAYYVRPQHTAIEAAWRQALFRQPSSPSEVVIEQAKTLHYLRTKEGVNDRAPHVDFAMRPFRSDLLGGASAVSDFTRTFLSIDTSGPDIHENSGLPLELVNRLRHAPDGVFWNGAVERYPRRKLRAAAARLELPASPEIKRSRHILRAYCREVFEDDNRELIRQLSWPTHEFVPAARIRGHWDLTELDDLWTPNDSPAELARLFDELSTALEGR